LQLLLVSQSVGLIKPYNSENRRASALQEDAGHFVGHLQAYIILDRFLRPFQLCHKVHQCLRVSGGSAFEYVLMELEAHNLFRRRSIVDCH
jgi:hypothetical protein